MNRIKGLIYGSKLKVFVANDELQCVQEITVVYQDDVFYEEDPYGGRTNGRRFEWSDLGETEREAILNRIYALKSQQESAEKRIIYWGQMLPCD